MTEHAPESTTNSAWDQTFALLGQRYPGQKPSVLFCIWKLQSNPDISLRDFRAEADLLGIPVAGRALHSAKVLLGMEQPATRRPKAVAAAEAPAKAVAAKATRGRPAAAAAPKVEANGPIENQLLSAVRQMQASASADAHRLRAAIREAIDVLQAALGDD